MEPAAPLDDGGTLDSLKVTLGDKLRDGIRKALVQIMTAGTSDEKGRGKYIATKLALAIEDEVNLSLKADQRAYLDKLRSIMANLKDPKNPDLRERLMNGRLTPRQVATLDAKKLASAQQQAERELQEL